MTKHHAWAHAVHDLGLAAWFGGSLMGVVGVNGAAADVDDPRHRARVADAGWGSWTPVNLLAISAHLLAAAQLRKAGRGLLGRQRRSLTHDCVTVALTAGAVGATAYARVLAQQLLNAEDVPVVGRRDALLGPTPEVARIAHQLTAVQWAIPGLTGALLVSSSVCKQYRRPMPSLSGVLRGLPDQMERAAASAAQATKQRASELR